MKKALLLLSFLTLSAMVRAQDEWPRVLESPRGKVTIYQPQPESFSENKIVARAAIAVTTPDNPEPIFGAMWIKATVLTDRDTRMATLESIIVNEVKLPGITDQVKINKLRNFIEMEIPKWDLEISLDRLAASLELTQQEMRLAEGIKNDPPTIFYTNQPTLLVLIDGEPKIQKDEKLGIERVMNTPFLLVKNTDGKFYLSGDQGWFESTAIKEGWKISSKPPAAIVALEKKLETRTEEKKPEDKSTENKPKTAQVMVSLVPAELIQSEGDAKLNPIQGTALLYMTNTDNDIFLDINSQQYYALISGRWYLAPKLVGPWTYVASDALPADFKKIPEGSDKDNVLSSVAGTIAAKEAVTDAMVPQTAKVDRKKATTSVTYDGTPKFKTIEGTTMEYAVNTSSSVIREGSLYYVVDNGVWFVGNQPEGPWSVATERPSQVEKIPASEPSYNVKYVYVYNVTPEYVYMGYTPGYMGCYVYGPTVVYGTGYYYAPWYGAYYYPRPVTYGFGMSYNPWTGWGMSYGFSTGGLTVHVGVGGWWGPPVYHPAYRPPYHHYYGGRPVVVHNNVNINNFNRTNNNIYNGRKDVVSRDKVSNRPTASTGVKNNRLQNDVHSDRDGNVFKRDDKGGWQQRDNNQWKPSNQNRDASSLNNMQQSRDRGAMQNNSFRQSTPTRSGGMGGGGRGGRRR